MISTFIKLNADNGDGKNDLILTLDRHDLDLAASAGKRFRVIIAEENEDFPFVDRTHHEKILRWYNSAVKMRNAYMTAADEWMKSYDELKEKHSGWVTSDEKRG